MIAEFEVKKWYHNNNNIAITFHLLFDLKYYLMTYVYTQGLYEYVKPAWQARPRPQINEEKVKKFGENVAPRPLNPGQKEIQLYPATTEIAGIQAPRSLQHTHM